MEQPGRSVGQDYSYGMNGQLHDDDVFKGFNSADFWGYDSRLGRRWEQDPLSYEYQSPYATFNNNPILFFDRPGLEGENQLPVPLFLDLKETPKKNQITPLSTDMLRAMGRGQSNLEGILFNKLIGKAFENVSIVAANKLKISSIGWKPVLPNRRKYPSALRKQLTNGKVRSVIPDGIGNVSGWQVKGSGYFKGFNYEFKSYSESSFYEVKAFNGTLNYNSNDYQIAGYIDIASKSSAAKNGGGHFRPSITFITTSNTIIGKDVINEANMMGVVIFQIVAGVGNDGAIYLSDPVQLTSGKSLDLSELMFDFFTGFYFDANWGIIPDASDDPDPEILENNDIKK